MLKATWTKLREGNFGLRVHGRPQPGEAVEVTTKSGATSTETVERVIWTGADNEGNEISLCSKAEKAAPSRSRHVWYPCGYPGCSPSFCDECDGQGGARARA